MTATSNLQLSTNEVKRIAIYCGEEVKRQYSFGSVPSYAPTGMMLAWMNALELQFAGSDIEPGTIREWGALIEPAKNAAGFRSVPVFVGGKEKLDYKLIDRALYSLCTAMRLGDVDAFAAYREFEEIHPFIDGNGRTGKIILNWMHGTLLDPIFPPEDFWGPRIANP